MKALKCAVVVSLLWAGAAQAETLKGFQVGPEGLTFQVSSGGCTSKDDFEIVSRETFPVMIELARPNQDFCEAFLPYGTTVSFSWEELGLRQGDQFTLTNELQNPYTVFQF